MRPRSVAVVTLAVLGLLLGSIAIGLPAMAKGDGRAPDGASSKQPKASEPSKTPSATSDPDADDPGGTEGSDPAPTPSPEPPKQTPSKTATAAPDDHSGDDTDHTAEPTPSPTTQSQPQSPKAHTEESSGSSIQLQDDSYSTDVNTTLTVGAAEGVRANDTGEFSHLSVTGHSHGSVSLSDDGSFTFTPEQDFVGEATFSYATAGENDSEGGDQDRTGGDAATARIDVQGPPKLVACGDSYTVTPGVPLTVAGPGVLANDPDKDHGTPVVVSQPLAGSLTLNPDGGFTYTPSILFLGHDQFSYQLRAATGYQASDPVTVSLDGATAPQPVASDDSYTAPAGGTLTVAAPGVLANDAGAVSVDSVQVEEPSIGTVQAGNDGSFTYEAPADSGVPQTATFRYRYVQLGVTSTWATVTISLTTGVRVVADSYSFESGRTLVVPAPGPLGNDTFPPDEHWQLLGCSQPEHASVTCRSDGAITMQAAAGFTGRVTFTYRVGPTQGQPRVLPRFAALRTAAPSAVGASGTVTVSITPPRPPSGGTGGTGDPGGTNVPEAGPQAAAAPAALVGPKTGWVMPNSGSSITGALLAEIFLLLLAGATLVYVGRRRRA